MSSKVRGKSRKLGKDEKAMEKEKISWKVLEFDFDNSEGLASHNMIIYNMRGKI